MSTPAETQEYQEYLAQTVQIRQAIENIQVTINQIRTRFDTLVKSSDKNVANEKEACLNLVDDTYANIKVVKKAIKDFETQILGKLEQGTTEYRIVKNQLLTLSKSLVEKSNELNRVQEDYHQKWTEKIKRQLEFSGITDQDEQNRILESGSISQQLNMDLNMSRQMLSDVQDRANDIERLEKNIRELHQMFLDMAELVAEQGQTIDNIEFNVNQTRDYVAETRKELPKAVDFKRAARRKKIIIAVIIVIVLVVIGIIVAVSVGPFLASKKV